MDTIKSHLFPGNAHIGTILRVHPTSHSNVAESYYVEIIHSSNDGFKTTLPKGHVRTFSYSAPEWRHYHFNRIEVIGDGNKFGHLLHNQTIVYKGGSRSKLNEEPIQTDPILK